MMKTNYPTVEVYITDISKRTLVEINFGGRIESLEAEKARILAYDILKALHQNQPIDRYCIACKALLEENSVYCDVCGTDTPSNP